MGAARAAGTWTFIRSRMCPEHFTREWGTTPDDGDMDRGHRKLGGSRNFAFFLVRRVVGVGCEGLWGIAGRGAGRGPVKRQVQRVMS